MTPWPVANPWSAPVLYLESTLSTMEDAQRLEEQGYPSGTVVVAGFQERGRGRHPERVWTAEPGKNLLFTLMLSLPDDFPPQRLPLLAGLALALTVEERFGLSCRVKWPNDLLHEGRKLAGVLCLARSRAAIAGSASPHASGPARAFVGVGLNCNQRSFAPELAGKACSLAGLLGREVALPELLAEVLAALRAALKDEDWRARLQHRLYGVGREARLAQDAGPALAGRLRGVAEDGALLLESAGAIIPAYSGELSFQPEA
jgi:BirA family biotin operon repressor/biotin-[acetyl-CoA-carboxylase] ligase